MSYATGTSDLAQWTRILHAFEGSPWPHRRVLDVGAGWGKAAVLLREYLNVKPDVVHAIEADEGLSAWLAEARMYDRLFGRTRIEEFTRWDEYDSVLMADVIEHMAKLDGQYLLDRIPGQIIVSTPVDPDLVEHERLATEIPSLERHVSLWSAQDFANTHRMHKHWHVGGQLIVRLAPKAEAHGHDPMRGQ